MTDTRLRRGPLAVLLTGTFLIVLDFFVVNVALPSVQRDLHADNTALEWLVARYGLTFGGLLLLTSRVADRWGRRRVFVLGVALFVASSALCLIHPSWSAIVFGFASTATVPLVALAIHLHKKQQEREGELPPESRV